MQDNRISLDGTWEFLHVADDRLSGPAEVRQIVVPSPWQAQFSDLRMRAGIGIYRKTIQVDESWLHDSIWLRFGAVFHNSKVWLNGELLGSNEGGFLPFSFEVTPFLKRGPNEIKVRVDSPTDNPAEFPDSPFAEIPFGPDPCSAHPQPADGPRQSEGVFRAPAERSIRRARPGIQSGGGSRP